MSPAPEALAKQSAERDEYTRAIVESGSGRRLVVAGPGTGKTYTFRSALERAGGRGLALTFVRNLAADLGSSLADVADVFTFHGYCKHLFHAHPVEGLTDRWEYYPPFLEVIVADFAMLQVGGVTARELDSAFQTVDDSDGLLDRALELGTYYDASSHADIVLRVLHHFEARPDAVPRYPLVVVDEYQDFTPLEIRFIEALAGRSAMLIAGDDDQALYEFRSASAASLRALAADERYERFTLGYCSRCPTVLVAAALDFIASARNRGLLEGRLEKRFECFLPDKWEISERYPRIFHAACSVESRKAPYAGLYIERQIRAIPADAIERSRKGNYPTVLVIGPPFVVRLAYDVLVRTWPHAEFRRGTRLELAILDGYRMLLANRASRLGWRLITMFDAPSDRQWIEAIASGFDFVSVLPEEYRQHHLKMVEALGAFLNGDEIAGLSDLLRSCGTTRDGLLTAAKVNIEETAPGNPPDIEGAPTIVCTSLEGAKGLSAEHVFVLGLTEGQFPRDPERITDHEACCFIVALTRARSSCHVVSHRMFGGQKWLRPSPFLSWIKSHLEPIAVDKAYIHS